MNAGHRWEFLPVETLVFMAFGQVAHIVAEIPPWVGGGVSALLVGLLLRFLDPSLKVWGERFRDRKK
jgi:hypothetical protein